MTLDFGDEGGDGSSDRLRMILLKIVNAVAELDELAILELTGQLLRESSGTSPPGSAANRSFG
jgi:hypothetical protein